MTLIQKLFTLITFLLVLLPCVAAAAAASQLGSGGCDQLVMLM
jgi:hypothetical protein